MAAIAQSAAVKTEDVTDADVARGYVIHPSQRDIQPAMRVVDAEVAQTLPSGKNYSHNVKNREKLRAIEAEMQKSWEESKVFEVDAPAADEVDEDGKFFCTFPYPYMNGRLHLGHAFTITKSEFAAGYWRLKGKRVLFPFSFHCTGMPIQAAANKLKREIEKFGLENCLAGNFEEPEEEAAKAAPAEASSADSEAKPGQFKGKKTKLMAKIGKKKKTQWEILLACRVPKEEIPKFVDSIHWLKYFPPFGKSDLKVFGIHTDWRRSFITTSANPFYDSYIRWQFRRLKAGKYLDFGERPTVFSILDKQACADHDRSSGEGVTPQEYTLIKIRVKDEGVAKLKGDFGGRPVYLVAATLRPETMYGQTNCFVLPSGNYGAYAMASGEVFICSEHSIKNMAYQKMTAARARSICSPALQGWNSWGFHSRTERGVRHCVHAASPDHLHGEGHGGRHVCAQRRAR